METIIKNPTITPTNEKSFSAPDAWNEEGQYKLYVWDKADDGHGGIAFAIAKSEHDAKQLIIKKYESFDRATQKGDNVNWGTVLVLSIHEYGNYSFG